MKKPTLLLLRISMLSISLTTISACGGSGGSYTDSTQDDTDSGGLRPLEISVTSSKSLATGESIDYIDVSMVGSHNDFKLTFTNLNKVAVTTPINLAVDFQWYVYQASPDKQNYPTEAQMDAYSAESNPGINNVRSHLTDFITRTTNKDDCLNTESIAQGGSCSYYTTATWIYSYSTRNTFSYPLMYIIEEVDGGGRLNVMQCTYMDGSIPAYSCGSASKPGYDKQFVTYKINPLDSANVEVTRVFGTFATGGEYAYINDHGYGTMIDRVPVSYINNTVLFGDIISSYMHMYNTSLGAITYDGTNQWSQYYGNAFLQIYSAAAKKLYDIPNGYYVDAVTASANQMIFPGLDNSTWVNIFSYEHHNHPSNVYNPVTDTFESTNIPYVTGVMPDGVVIGWEGDLQAGTVDHTYHCWRLTGKNTYTSQLLISHTGNTVGYGDEMGPIYNGIYIPITVSGLQDRSGEGITGWYKIHTDNGHCYTESDDYMSGADIIATPEYTLVDGNNGSTPTSNVYLGKQSLPPTMQ